MANNTLNQNVANEKSLSNLMLDADCIFIALEAKIKAICNQMMKEGMDREFIIQISDLLPKISSARFHLDYYHKTLEDFDKKNEG
jgi:uncharacterized membrane protein